MSNTFKQRLRIKHRQPVLIKVPTFYSAEPLKIIHYENLKAAHIPLDPVTRAKLTEIDSFVEQAVDSPTYKPIWKGDVLFVNFSRWCKYEIIMPDGSRQPMSSDTALLRGMYSVVIQASHVYVGPHKSGETYSVSLHIRELLYEPEQNLSDWFDTLMSTPPPSAARNDKPPNAPKRRTQKKRRGKDEVDIVPSV